MGLIPAYAGRTSPNQHGAGWGWAHPRLRGADPIMEAASSELAGSSPLTRGGRVPPPAPHLHGGLIPAYAGRTCCPEV
ncbi:hypothetical protein U2A4042520096 [Corynebacterium striatum]|nr:hypothetical protein U2A4042520096 [Corynebacterium striatum]